MHEQRDPHAPGTAPNADSTTIGHQATLVEHTPIPLRPTSEAQSLSTPWPTTARPRLLVATPNASRRLEPNPVKSSTCDMRRGRRKNQNRSRNFTISPILSRENGCLFLAFPRALFHLLEPFNFWPWGGMNAMQVQDLHKPFLPQASPSLWVFRGHVD